MELIRKNPTVISKYPSWQPGRIQKHNVKGSVKNPTKLCNRKGKERSCYNEIKWIIRKKQRGEKKEVQ